MNCAGSGDLALRFTLAISVSHLIFMGLSSLCVCMLSHFSRVQLFVTLWTVAHQAPLSTGKNTGVGCCALLKDRRMDQNLRGIHFLQWSSFISLNEI